MSLIASFFVRAAASDNINAIAPVTAGAAILVPDFCVTPVPVRERAATTACPGAQISGFCRPSRVGPALEKNDTGTVALCASYDPTTIVSRPHEMDPIVCELSNGSTNV